MPSMVDPAGMMNPFIFRLLTIYPEEVEKPELNGEYLVKDEPYSVKDFA